MSTVIASNVAALRFLWRTLEARERRRLLGLQLLAVLMAVSTLGGITAVLPFFAVLADPGSLGRHQLLAQLQGFSGIDDPQRFALLLGGLFLLTVIVANTINLVGMLAINRFALSIGREFHVSLFDEYLNRDYLFHARGEVAPLINNIVFEATRVAAGFVQGGLTLVASLLAGLCILATAFVVDARVALGAAVLIGGTYGLIYLLAQRRLADHGRRESQLWDARTRILTEAFGSIAEIRLRGLQTHFRDVFARQCESLADANAKIHAITNGPRFVLDTVMAIALVAAALWLSRGTAASAWIAELGFFALAAYRLLPTLQQGYAAATRMRADRTALARIAADLVSGRSRAPAPPLSPGGLARWAGSPRSAITVEHVSFRYSKDAPLAIRDASFSLRRGECVGFVGPNGSGKSTMSALLLGLLEPESGAILVDGEPLAQADLRYWQSTVAYVPQHVFLFDASIADNITFGAPAGDIDAARLDAAVRAASLQSLVAQLPQGLATRIGERGARLSGGQQQRIGIARALYRQASFLVLDEATSALDGLAQRDVVATLEALRGVATVALIAHNMSSVRSCDAIFEFDGGCIVGRGTFDELWRDSLRFRELANRA